MPFDMSRLGPLLAGLGLNPPPETVKARLDGAAEAAAGLTAEQLPALICEAVGAPVEAAALAGFSQHFRDKDGSFGAEPDSPEMRLLASCVVTACATGGHPLAPRLAIVTGAALLGGLRSSSPDPNFREIMETALDKLQRQPTPSPSLITEGQPLDLTEQLAALKATQDQEGWSDFYSNLEEILDVVIRKVTSQAQITQLNLTITRQQQLAEQMEMQWWVVNGYSSTAKAPFSSLPAAECISRASRELAGLTERQAGPLSAPALLDQVLAAGKASRKRVAVLEVAKAGPLAWRQSWITLGISGPAASLCPIIHAIRLATEAGDADDWTGRFERETGIPAKEAFDGIDLALQLYRESLAARILGGTNG